MTTDKMIEIIENIKEVADRMKESKASDKVALGQVLAYAEVLTIIQEAYAGENLAEIGLDFDIDKRYL